MSFKKWFESEEEKGFVIGDDGDYKYMYCDLQEAYEAGQRDMRERAAKLCKEEADMYRRIMAPSDAIMTAVDLAADIRAIKLESEQ